MQKFISIIVPIYHGQKYMRGLIVQIEDASREISGYVTELLFVNDDPDLPINPVFKSELIDIQVINTNVNRGIHGARVEGLLRCRGEFILFLDQDDKIDRNFLTKQLALIGEADAIVCP